MSFPKWKKVLKSLTRSGIGLQSFKISVNRIQNYKSKIRFSKVSKWKWVSNNFKYYTSSFLYQCEAKPTKFKAGCWRFSKIQCHTHLLKAAMFSLSRKPSYLLCSYLRWCSIRCLLLWEWQSSQARCRFSTNLLHLRSLIRVGMISSAGRPIRNWETEVR